MELPSNWGWLPVITFAGFLILFEITAVRKNRILHGVFLVCYTVFSLVMAIDTIYYSYFGQFVSINQLWQIDSLWAAGTETNLISALSIPWGLLLLVDIPFMTTWHKKRASHQTKWQKTIWWPLALLVAAVAFLAGYSQIIVNSGLRGDFMRINHLEFLTCHGNDIYTTVEEWKSKADVDEEEIKKIIQENVPQAETSNLRGVAAGKNLILIQVESLNGWPIGKTYEGQEITPNINALLQKDTIYFSKVFSSTGKGNTSDAEFAALNSLYPTTVRECYRMYVNNTYNGIPWILRSLGYETMAFHGYEKEFWNRNIAYKNQGIQTFYSESELEMTEQSGFGLTDKEMFRQAVDILKEKSEPWFAFMITLTNHIPYDLDDSLTSLELADSEKGTLAGRYMQSVRYTDEAIGELIEELKDAGLYENTVIAFYGDHQGLNKETEAVETTMTHILGREYDYDEMMRVPFVIHIPGLSQSRTIDTVGGQVDILPTLANLMDLPVKQDYIFGSDLLNISREDGFYAPVTYMPVGSYMKNDYFYELGRDGTFESGRAVELFTGKGLTVSGTWKKYSERAKLLIETSKKVLDANLMKGEVEHD
jgi:phosphoglycerol transferase MdoB-like AlkP superfamily enzyme